MSFNNQIGSYWQDNSSMAQMYQHQSTSIANNQGMYKFAFPPQNPSPPQMYQPPINHGYFPAQEFVSPSSLARSFSTNFSTPNGAYIQNGYSPIQDFKPPSPSTIEENGVAVDPQVIRNEEKEVRGLTIDKNFYELQRFAYDGCVFAEMVAQSYRKRPCFKKIDLLLSRLKNDLNVYHNILSNVNSQGTPWAIKDFTFAYSRIINAWVILRGYVYDQTEGLDRLRCEFDADFADNFSEWQMSTLKMLTSLMRTVENLNNVSQQKSGSERMQTESFFKKKEVEEVYSKEFLEAFQKNLFKPRCAPNSEEIQLRNHHSRAYFRAGLLKPLLINNGYQNSSLPDSPGSVFTETTPPSSSADDAFNWWNSEDLSGGHSFMNVAQNGASGRLYNRKSNSLPNTPNNEDFFDFSVNPRAKKALLETFNSVENIE